MCFLNSHIEFLKNKLYRRHRRHSTSLSADYQSQRLEKKVWRQIPWSTTQDRMLLIWKVTNTQTSLKTASPSENKVYRHQLPQKLAALENDNHTKGTFRNTAGLTLTFQRLVWFCLINKKWISSLTWYKEFHYFTCFYCKLLVFTQP